MPIDPGKTRVVRLEGGQRREQADNNATVILDGDLAPLLLGARPSFEQLFVANYGAIRHACASFGRPGVAAIAVDTETGRLAGSVCVAAKNNRANAAIIGRHSMTDLYLDADPNLSLRHLALITHPYADDVSSDLRFRLLDLRTPLSFFDENSRRLEALVAEGPIFIRVGRYALFCLPTGDVIGWPESDGTAGWACIPERVYLAETDAEPDRWERRQRMRRGARRRQRAGENADVDGDGFEDGNKRPTMVQTLGGPARSNLLDEGDRPLGALQIEAGGRNQELLIGERAAERGVLLGRYDRCDIGGAAVLTDENVSRVHLLVLYVDEQLYAVDTASTNGTWLREEHREVRIARVERGRELMLGEDLAYLNWRPGGVRA